MGLCWSCLYSKYYFVVKKVVLWFNSLVFIPDRDEPLPRCSGDICH